LFFSEAIRVSDKTRAGFSLERLAKIDRFLAERYVDAGRLPMAQVSVLRHGELVHRASLGHADPQRGAAIADDTIFRIYSMTKPVTAVAFMMLMEEGKVALDDPVAKFIPAWTDLGVFKAGAHDAWLKTPPAKPMRIVDLLRHTSGLTYGFQTRTNVDQAYRRLRLEALDNTQGLDGLIESLGKLPLEFSPGESWNYGLSTDVLGYLVGKISGTPFDTFLAERLFKPLGMDDTGFSVREGQGHRLAACYTLRPDGVTELQDDPKTSAFLKAPGFVSGGGGLVSTSADYIRFVQMLMGKGSLDGRTYLSPKTLELMTSNHLPGGQDLAQASISMFSESIYEGVGFGLGFAVTMDPARTLVHGSRGDFYWGGMASTYFWVDPTLDLACVLMTQLMPSSSYPIRRELRTLVYSALVEP